MTDLKAVVGAEAAERVKDGMKLGIGTGSTAEAFVRALAVRVAGGLDIIGVPTSERTAALCVELGVPLTTLEDTPSLDLTIDGADEIGPDLVLIKGGGGALLREKIVASASKKMLVIADDSKIVDPLGAFPLPIEVLPFGLAATRRAVQAVADEMELSGEIKLRMSGDTPYLTDGKHFILDASFGRIVAPEALAARLSAIAGVMEHGLFVDIASEALVAHAEGVKLITR
ncbi:MAG: ribose-5-phosphate isomerase RpiA [Pseudomonadota bacterium]